jgi:uncharacterized protein YdaU (DUF1376 family)
MSRPWMPLYVADYLADTGHLSTIEHGAYMLLIMHYWATGGLPNDDKRLASIARASLEQWSDMRTTMAEFFGDDWKHERIDAELENAAKAYERRAAAGKAGGKAKASKASIAVALPEQSHSQPQKKEDANASKTRASKPDFETWYWHYPHKVQRGAAEKAFEKARQTASLEELIAGVQRYIASKPIDRQWQNPATWLNGKGWLDAPAPAPRPHSTASPPAPRNAGERAFLRLQAENGHDPTDTVSKRLEPGDGRRQIEGNGDAWPVAGAQGAFGRN